MTRSISLGLTVEAAWDKLAKFDSTFLSELVHVTREKRNAYFTVGHGERNEKGDSERPATARIKGFEALLRAQNFTVKPLGLAEGLGQEVPTDADLVVVAGPQLPFRRSEEDALGRYLDQGGNLMAFLEPDSGKAAPGLPVAADAPPALSGFHRHARRKISCARIFPRAPIRKAFPPLPPTLLYGSPRHRL